MLLLALVPSCQSPDAEPLPPARPVIDLKMRDYAFEYPATIPSGQVTFRIVNVGKVNHRLILAPLPDDFPPLQEQIRGDERRSISPLAGIPDRRPGEGNTFAVFLAPGRYALICYTLTPEGEPHAAKGMASEFRIA